MSRSSHYRRPTRAGQQDVDLVVAQRQRSGGFRADILRMTVIPAGAHDLAIAPTVAASRALGVWYPMRTGSGLFPSAVLAASGLAAMNPSAPTASPLPTASSATGLSRVFAIGTSALRAITSRGVHVASARRACGAASGPCAEKSAARFPPRANLPGCNPRACSARPTSRWPRRRRPRCRC